MSLGINKKTTCLVVIDLQKGVAAMQTQPYDAKSVISNTAKLARAFRENKMAVFLVHVTASPGTMLQTTRMRPGREERCLKIGRT